MLRIAVLSLIAAWAACAGRPAAPPGVRVVSLHDVTTELVVALGAGDRLAGVIDPVDVAPEAALAIARTLRVGDLESILAARPTIVVGLQVVADRDPELVARLRDAGVEVYLAELTRLDDVFALAGALGARIGEPEAGARLAGKLAADAAALAPAPGAHRPRVFVYDCCDPPFTAGGRAVLGDLIARAGGDNVFADLGAAWAHVAWEQVVARRPELVVIDAYAFTGQGDIDDKRRAVQAIPALAGVPTVVMPLGLVLGGIRSVDGLARLRAAIGGP